MNKDIYFIIDDNKNVIKAFLARSDFMAKVEFEDFKIDNYENKYKLIAISKKLLREIET